MNYERLLAGCFAGAGALILLYKGENTAATAILASMLAFFVGEKNGQKKAVAASAS
jgi:hypothetical protein